jgi:hypothetical protein
MPRRRSLHAENVASEALSDVLNGEALTGGRSGDCSIARVAAPIMAARASMISHDGIEFLDFKSGDNRRGMLSVDMRGNENKHPRGCDRRKCEAMKAHLICASRASV